MKAQQLIERIKTGSEIRVIDHIIIKRGKVKKGYNRKYYCDDDSITVTQFNNVRYLLGANTTNQISNKIYLFNPSY